MIKSKIAMTIIDPQYDFHDVPENHQVITGYVDEHPMRVAPALAVKGAWEDAKRLGAFITKFSGQISKIIVTLDTHQRYDIAHPLYWRDANGNAPLPFILKEGNSITPITHQMVLDGEWSPVDPVMRQHALDYTLALEDGGKYALMIWPPHCLVGEPGHNIISPIMDAIAGWEEKRFTRYMPLSKGHNPHTEHFGACEAEYPMANDPTTRLNKRFIDVVEAHDWILLSGQALSHCLASTVRQIADNFNADSIKKMVLLVDTSSPVEHFEKEGKDFIDEMLARGMRVMKTTDVKINRHGDLVF